MNKKGPITRTLKKNIRRIRHVKKKDVFVFFALLVSAIILILFLKNYNPQGIVEYLGIGNVYLIVFIFAVIGGVSFVSATYFYATYLVFVLGGINPIALAVFAAMGLTMGDLFFYFIGLRGSKLFRSSSFRERNKKKIEWIKQKVKDREFWFIYIYAGFIPFPKDILSFALGIFDRRVKKIILPLLLGNFTYNLLLAYLVILGFL